MSDNSNSPEPTSNPEDGAIDVTMDLLIPALKRLEEAVRHLTRRDMQGRYSASAIKEEQVARRKLAAILVGRRLQPDETEALNQLSEV